MTTTTKPRRAFFAGSFNPFTIGHASIVERGLEIFDTVVIGVGISATKSPGDVYGRLDAIMQIYERNPRVEVMAYDTLTVDAARNAGCQFLLRGVRNVADFEYERNIAVVNLKLSGIETVILLTRPELATVSSSLVRELQSFGKDVSQFLPTPPDYES